MNVKELVSVSLILFSVIDIAGSLPIIIDLQKKGLKIESLKASIIAFILMLAFLFFGESLLQLFGVDVQSFAVAGAIIIFLLGIEMILGITLFRDNVESSSGTIVPIAFPLIAGAGTMTTILSMRAKYDALEIAAAILINIIIVYMVLRSSRWLGSKLGENGANILRKVFGIILLAIAIKLFKENVHFIKG
ncbi:MAG: MarC family protein [Bacteroidota bacterium]